MAQRQYEYFGNRSVAKSPLLAARYGRGQLYGQRLANNAAAQNNWMRDPYFMLGSSIGQALGDAYNERGISKGRKEMNEALNGYLGQFASQPNAGMEQEGVFNKTMPTNEMLNNNFAQIENGALRGIDNAIAAPMTPQEAYKQYKNDAWVEKYRGEDPNPDSTSISVKNDIQNINQMGNGLDFSNVDKEQAREYVRQQLEQNGRTPYQIEQVLGQFDNIYDSKYNKWRVGRATELLEKGRQAAAEGRFADAENNFMAAAEYNPDSAKLRLSSLYNNMQRNYTDQNADFKKKLELAKSGLMLDSRGNIIPDPNHPLWRKSAPASGGAGNGNVVGVLENGSPYTPEMFDRDITAITKLSDSTDPGDIKIVKSARARLLQLGYNINFIGNKQVEDKSGPAKKADTKWIGDSANNTDDDNYMSPEEKKEYYKEKYKNTYGGYNYSKNILDEYKKELEEEL